MVIQRACAEVPAKREAMTSVAMASCSKGREVVRGAGWVRKYMVGSVRLRRRVASDVHTLLQPVSGSLRTRILLGSRQGEPWVGCSYWWP